MLDDDTLTESRAAGYADTAPSRGVLPPPTATEAILGRYRRTRLLGRGGFGEAWLAEDVRSGEVAVVKLVAGVGPRDIERVRREASALRFARLPGIVRLREDGFWQIWFCLVTDRIAGQPFPGHDHTPDAVARVTRRLLQVLARLHRHRGLAAVHRDLKPANVLVDDRGHPTVLDLGLMGPAHEADRRTLTPAFAAPEQFHGRADQRSDLYAVGRMVQWALGPHLHAHPALAECVGWMTQPEPDRRPANAEAVLRRLDGEVPHGQLDALLRGHGTERFDRPTLRSLFAGPPLYLRLAEDAADTLFARTGGHRSGVQRALRSWLDAGLCHLTDPTEQGDVRVQVTRASLDRLAGGLVVRAPEPAPPLTDTAALLLGWLRLARRPVAPERLAAWMPDTPGDALASAFDALRRGGLAWSVDDAWAAEPGEDWPGDVRSLDAARATLAADPALGPARAAHLAAADARPEQLDGMLDAAEGAVLDGESTFARVLCERAADIADACGWLTQRRRAISLLASVALSTKARRPIDRVLERIDRSLIVSARGPIERSEAGRLQRVRDLIAASARAWDDPTQCGGDLVQLGSMKDESLECLRQAARVAAAWQVSDPSVIERLYGELRAWATTPTRRAWLSSWRGLRAYRAGRYAEAVDHHRAAAARPRLADRAASLLNAAAAAVEIPDADAVREYARAAEAMAIRMRNAHFEADAACLLRMADYRAARALTPEPARVEAVRALASPRQTGAVALLEAAIAWRCGQRALGDALAAEAVIALETSGARPVALLARALRCACGHRPDDARALVRALEQVAHPEFRFQGLVLLHVAGCHRLSDVELSELAEAITPARRRHRLDVLAVRDAGEIGESGIS